MYMRKKLTLVAPKYFSSRYLIRSFSSAFTRYDGDCFAKDPIYIRGRKYLPGSTSHEMPSVLNASPKPYLTTVVPNFENKNIEKLGVEMGELVKNLLPKFPAILFKSLPLKTASDVGKLVAASGLDTMSYKDDNAFRSGSRSELYNQVYHAGTDDERFTIELHNEMSYLKHYPSKVSSSSAQNLLHEICKAVVLK